MYKPEYGEPVMTLRLPTWMHAGLKIAARKEGTTVSGILRELAAAKLKEHGITAEGAKPIDGQITLEDV